jgi:hypothetical protein
VGCDTSNSELDYNLWWVLIVMCMTSSKKQLAFITALFIATIPIGLSLDYADMAGLLNRVNHFDMIQSVGIALGTFTNVATTTMISFRILSMLYSVRKSIDFKRAKVYTGLV